MLSRYVSIIEFDFFLYRVYTYPVEKVNNYVGSSSLIAQILDEHKHKLAHIHVDSSLKISRVINFSNTSKETVSQTYSSTGRGRFIRQIGFPFWHFLCSYLPGYFFVFYLF